MKIRILAASALILAMAACKGETVSEKANNAAAKVSEATHNAADNVRDAFDAVGDRDERPQPQVIEQERFNEQWRRLKSLRAAQAAQAAPPAPVAPPANMPQIVVKPKFDEKLKGAPFDRIDTLPVTVPIQGDAAGPSVLRAQVLLDRANYSIGVLDGRWGRNSAIAVYWFQRQSGIEPTGVLDKPTFERLFSTAGGAPALQRYTVTADDTSGPFTKIPDDVYEQEKLDCLCYENLGEKLAEKFHTTTEFLETLNPDLKVNSLTAGQTLLVPNVRQPITTDTVDVARVVISVRGSYLNAYDSAGRLLFHAPTTLGSKYDPSPTETLKIVAIAQKPHFHYQPTLFHEVPDSNPEANLQPGPNSPVGMVWIALSKEHYGIHGTAYPESIGYSSSHGCIRLANWDAMDLSHRVTKGVVVEFVDTRHESDDESDSSGTTSSDRKSSDSKSE